MGADDASIAVEEAALLVAAHLRPGLDVGAELTRIDRLAEGCADDSLDAICDHLFGDLGFVGNSDRYYDPANSCLDHVIDARTGIPITLSVLLIAVARRRHRKIEGIGLPGHFMVRDVESGLYIDPFGGGTRFDEEGCRKFLARLHGTDLALPPSAFEPVGARMIIRRMLNNLVSIARAECDRPSLVIATRLRAILPDASVPERGDYADALVGVGEIARAACVIEAIAADAPPAEADGLRTAAARLRASLN